MSIIHDIIFLVMFMKRALVLSGGGAKGAYQIGVWKALRKLKIDFQIVTGTSVGALNGTFMVQNDYFKAKRMWKNMSFHFVFDDDVLKQYNNCETTTDMIQMFGHNFLKNGGMEVENLEKLALKYFSARKFFNSSRDFGVTTYNFTDKKPVKIQKKDLTKDNVIDYIMASSCCFPAFQMRKIDSKKYIDGGFFDYIPINLALDMGADEVIAVDLHAPGIHEKIQNTNVPITYIEPHNDIGGFLEFNSINARRAMRFGYFDTMKQYHYLDGVKYTFKKGTYQKCEAYYNLLVVENLNFIFDFHENKTTLEELLTLASYKRLVSIRKNAVNLIFADILEHLGETFDMDEQCIYSLSKFHRHIFKCLKKIPELNQENVQEFIKDKKLLSYLNRRSIIRYFYSQIILCHKDSSYKKPVCKLALLFPKEFLGALYLHAVDEKGLFSWW